MPSGTASIPWQYGEVGCGVSGARCSRRFPRPPVGNFSAILDPSRRRLPLRPHRLAFENSPCSGGMSRVEPRSQRHEHHREGRPTQLVVLVSASPRPHAPRLRSRRPDWRVLGDPKTRTFAELLNRLRGGSDAPRSWSGCCGRPNADGIRKSVGTSSLANFGMAILTTMG